MLAVISDLHLTDGTCGNTVAAGALELLVERLRAMALAASYRADGGYRPLERIDLLLLGDVLDVVRSARWTSRKDVRPWTDWRRPDFVELVTQITSDILRQNDQALSMLRNLAVDGTLTLPLADSLGHPVLAAEPQPVSVKIHYMVGDHDWFFRLPGPSYDLLRQALVRHLGLTNRAECPFAHDPTESAELLEVLRRHKVLARHGDVFDPLCFEGNRNASSLADALVVELQNRFLHHVEHDLSGELPAASIVALRDLDQVRPLLLAPVWIDGVLQRTCPRAEMRQRVKQLWNGLVEQFLELPFVRARDGIKPAAVVDGLAALLQFSQRWSSGWAASILAWLDRLRGSAGHSYLPQALAEPEFRNRRARHIVYGHTHAAETIPLEASFAEGYVLNQIYFNSGTWRRMYRATEIMPGKHEFVAAEMATLLAFYHGDERQGRPYETWHGTLGLAPLDTPTFRFDVPSAREAVAEENRSAMQGHAPHFHRAGTAQGTVPRRRV